MAKERQLVKAFPRISPNLYGGKVPNKKTDWMFPLPRKSNLPWGTQVAKRHAGLDVSIDATEKESVVAPESGEVIRAFETKYMEEPKGWKGYGPGAVVIKGKSGYYHLLAHLKGVMVKKGDKIEVAEPVAKGVESGKYDHVHWEVREKLTPSGANKYVWMITVDPARWINFEIVKAVDAVAKLMQGKKMREKYPVRLKGFAKAVFGPRKEKDFPWWMLVGVGVVAWFFMRDKR
jgi:murein DD-endopeptidase MepM/ murein hydrolase activator NlpD